MQLKCGKCTKAYSVAAFKIQNCNYESIKRCIFIVSEQCYISAKAVMFCFPETQIQTLYASLTSWGLLLWEDNLDSTWLSTLGDFTLKSRTFKYQVLVLVKYWNNETKYVGVSWTVMHMTYLIIRQINKKRKERKTFKCHVFFNGHSDTWISICNSLDLTWYGLPGPTRTDWRRDLKSSWMK